MTSATGKTVFLLYLLLWRLEHKLPTAIQLAADTFVMFDDRGAVDLSTEQRIRLPDEYWALADSNAQIIQPCAVFLNSPVRHVIQASSPTPDRWKEWIKQSMGRVVVTDLPRMFEILAIIKQLKLDMADAYRLIKKWGPCTRTILDILREPVESRSQLEEYLSSAARQAADAIRANPSICHPITDSHTPHGVGSALLFVRPRNWRDPDTRSRTFPGLATTCIPTPHLREIFNSSSQEINNAKAMELFEVLSTHALTRTGAGWLFEKRMHAYLGCSSARLEIIGAHDGKATMQATPKLVYGTVSLLAKYGTRRDFYWLPSMSNFPGIDGVLGDGDNVYAVQAAIANDHSSPEDGLRKVWSNFDKSVREQRTWHVVVVTDTQESARRYAQTTAEQMKNVTLGQAQLRVQVWGCVLPPE